VFPLAGEVHEAEVDGFDFTFTEERENFAGSAIGFAVRHGDGPSVGEASRKESSANAKERWRVEML
jgi:hypothetical protein